MAASKQTKIKEARKDYEHVKKVYNKIGRMTMGTRASDPIRRDYRTARRAYLAAGKKLGRLTGKKPRRGR